MSSPTAGARASSRARPRGDALAASFFAREAERVARDLLGAHLVSTVGGVTVAGRVVETEAYIGPHDDASHAAARIGRTARNAAMFGVPGTAYIYRIYGIHWCLNVVTDAPGYPAAVLIRAVEPVRGIDHMRVRREASGSRISERALCSGPGRLAQAFGITGDLDMHRLDGAPLWLRPGDAVPPSRIIAGPRIGVTRAAEWPLRFCVRDSRWLSR